MGPRAGSAVGLSVCNIFRRFCSTQVGAHAIERLKNGLYVVGTPIGNLEDITFRAISILRSSDIILCENVKKTRVLLQRHRILSDSNIKVVSYHDPFRGLTNSFLGTLDQIKYSAVSIVSDAGTPCISDPGHVLVKECHKAGIPVFGIPGASSVPLALSLSGFNADKFIFEGFLPKKKEEKKIVLCALANQSKTIVFFESPARIDETLKQCIEIFGAERNAAVMRELTKIYETSQIGSLEELQKSVRAKGEFTVVIEGML